MIVAAAIRINHAVISMAKPARHHDILRQINGLYWDHNRQPHTFDSEVQGFLTDEGAFLDREQAFEHARACKQPLLRGPNQYNGPSLFSEDLW